MGSSPTTPATEGFSFVNIQFMKSALKEAAEARERDSVPVGAVVVRNGQLISSAGNEVIKNCDPTAHAEVLAIRRACEILKTRVLDDCDLYVTLEPCAMCAQAISLARIRNLYFGAYDPKYGSVIHGVRIFQHSLHKPDVFGGIMETDCAKILMKFFQDKRH